MTYRLVHLLVLMLLVGISVNAQQGADFSVKQRAQSLEPYFLDSARRYGIDPRILRVLCYLESRFQLTAISPKGARGPMQFMPETAARYGLGNPHDPKSAIDAAARYFRDLLRRFDGRVDLALAAYNAGEGTVEAFRGGKTLVLPNNQVINPRRFRTDGIPPYEETRNYVARGEIIYRNIARTTFPGARSTDNSTQKHQQIEPPSVKDTARHDSVYTLDSSTQLDTRPATKPTTVVQANSLYVN